MGGARPGARAHDRVREAAGQRRPARGLAAQALDDGAGRRVPGQVRPGYDRQDDRADARPLPAAGDAGRDLPPRGPKDILSIPLPPHLRITLPPPFGGPLRANLPTLTASNLSIYTTPSSPTSSTSSPCLSKLLRSKPSFPKTSKRALTFHEPPPRPRSSHSCSHR